LLLPFVGVAFSNMAPSLFAKIDCNGAIVADIMLQDKEKVNGI
jgi:hypothetical protein